MSALWAVFSGFEAWYSRYKSRFRFWAQWTPVIMAPIQTATCIAAVANERAARMLLPGTSAMTLINGDRPHCIYRGFCIQGRKVGAKASTLITHVPEALRYEAEVRDPAMVFRISTAAKDRVDAVHYYDREGREHFQRAKAVIVCGYAVETPRLLLNSAAPGTSADLLTRVEHWAAIRWRRPAMWLRRALTS